MDANQCDMSQGGAWEQHGDLRVYTATVAEFKPGSCRAKEKMHEIVFHEEVVFASEISRIQVV
jgi:hypothetical protein